MTRRRQSQGGSPSESLADHLARTLPGQVDAILARGLPRDPFQQFLFGLLGEMRDSMAADERSPPPKSALNGSEKSG
jgi:hypothetical protein